MTESEAIERLKCLRLYMEINDRYSDIKFLDEYYEANNKAINALEKQIPKKVIYYRDGYYICPTCDHYICDKETAFSLDDTDFSYCDGCGQKLKWSDEE